jgi:hypothetical protein
MKRIRWSIAASIAGLAVLGCMRAATASHAGAPGQQPGQPPKLIVFITVDQLRGDMLDRHRRDMRYGYARLMRGGAWFVNGFQDHAITETAPGHASTLSGRFPRGTGIMENAAGVNDPAYPVLNGQSNEPGASPERFIGTTLYDWIAARSPAARALSVSRKDRGAILPIGRSKQEVYWYSTTGNFTTSRYYRDSLPAWVNAFNGRKLPHRYIGGQWRLTRDSSTYTEPDSVPEENSGRTVFPYQIPADTARALYSFQGLPAMDSVTALFALAGLRALDLGRGPHTDLLAVSFSVTDAVGHAYGPDSREFHENQIRLDETIGWFLDSLYAMRDSSSIIVALTGDHGVQPIPALARRRGEAKGNEGLIVSLAPLVAATRARLAASGADSLALLYDGQLVGIARDPLRQKGLNPDSILRVFRTEALAVPGIAHVDWIRDLWRANHERDPIARRWSHQIAETSDVELVITLTRYSYWYRAVATHGSPYDQDAHVPIIFYGPHFRAGRYTQMARTVDMAPTLARVLGLQPAEQLDGVPLTQVIK